MRACAISIPGPCGRKKKVRGGGEMSYDRKPKFAREEVLGLSHLTAGPAPTPVPVLQTQSQGTSGRLAVHPEKQELSVRGQNGRATLQLRMLVPCKQASG